MTEGRYGGNHRAHSSETAPMGNDYSPDRMIMMELLRKNFIVDLSFVHFSLTYVYMCVCVSVCITKCQEFSLILLPLCSESLRNPRSHDCDSGDFPKAVFGGWNHRQATMPCSTYVGSRDMNTNSVVWMSGF